VADENVYIAQEEGLRRIAVQDRGQGGVEERCAMDVVCRQRLSRIGECELKFGHWRGSGGRGIRREIRLENTVKPQGFDIHAQPGTASRCTTRPRPTQSNSLRAIEDGWNSGWWESLFGQGFFVVEDYCEGFSFGGEGFFVKVLCGGNTSTAETSGGRANSSQVRVKGARNGARLVLTPT
jgi:hypothetical protein